MIDNAVGKLTDAEVTLAHDSTQKISRVPPWPRHLLTEEAEQLKDR